MRQMKCMDKIVDHCWLFVDRVDTIEQPTTNNEQQL